MGSLWVRAINKQSFSNSFEGVHRVVKKCGRGSSFCVFYVTKSLLRVYMRCPPLPPSLPTLWASMCKTITDHINWLIIKTEYISYVTYVIERHLEIVQCTSVWFITWIIPFTIISVNGAHSIFIYDCECCQNWIHHN